MTFETDSPNEIRDQQEAQERIARSIKHSDSAKDRRISELEAALAERTEELQRVLAREQLVGDALDEVCPGWDGEYEDAIRKLGQERHELAAANESARQLAGRLAVAHDYPGVTSKHTTLYKDFCDVYDLLNEGPDILAAHDKAKNEEIDVLKAALCVVVAEVDGVRAERDKWKAKCQSRNPVVQSLSRITVMLLESGHLAEEEDFEEHAVKRLIEERCALKQERDALAAALASLDNMFRCVQPRDSGAWLSRKLLDNMAAALGAVQPEVFLAARLANERRAGAELARLPGGDKS